MPPVSRRLNNLPPYVFSVISDRIKVMQSEGKQVIRLDIGNPDLPPTNDIINTLGQHASKPDAHGYSGYRGIPVFRKAVTAYYEKRFGVSVDPDTEVLPLIGSKEGIINLSLAYIDADNTALVPDVGYPSYAMGTLLAGGTSHWMSLRTENNYLPVFDEIPAEVADSASLLWVNYPNNPTGAVANTKFYEDAVSFCKTHDILLVSDNPYADVTYDDYVACSALQANDALDHCIEFFSLSKSHNMAGWRLGAAVGSSAAIENLLGIKSNVDSGHFKPVYEAGAHALLTTPEEWIHERNQIYQRRRDLIMSALPQLGLTADKSKATLYIWAKVADGDDKTYVKRALEEAHISLAPGSAYGPGGEGYIRLSVGVTDEILEEALEKLISWYAS